MADHRVLPRLFLHIFISIYRRRVTSRATAAHVFSTARASRGCGGYGRPTSSGFAPSSPLTSSTCHARQVYAAAPHACVRRPATSVVSGSVARRVSRSCLEGCSHSLTHSLTFLIWQLTHSLRFGDRGDRPRGRHRARHTSGIHQPVQPDTWQPDDKATHTALLRRSLTG